LYKNYQRQSCSAINCLSSGINILAGGISVPLISERKGIDPHCVIYSYSAGGTTRREGRGGTMFTGQISSECVYCIGFRWPKTTNFGQILIFLGLLCRPPFTDERQIWCATAGRRSTLIRQISSECVHCVGFRWPKTTNLGKFWHFGGSCTDPLLPMRVKCGVL